jgi:hypothetical protein
MRLSEPQGVIVVDDRVNVPRVGLPPMSLSLSAALHADVSLGESEHSRFFSSVSTTTTASAAFPCDKYGTLRYISCQYTMQSCIGY